MSAETTTPYLDPFAPLADLPAIAIPETVSDAYTFVAYTATGEVIAEYAEDAATSWSRGVDLREVMFIDLLPIGAQCAEHERLTAGCNACLIALQRGSLRPHRLQVPEGGQAHFERRRLVAADNSHTITWTILGWRRSFLSVRPSGLKLADAGARSVEVAYYLYLDDYGRTFSTSRLDAI